MGDDDVRLGEKVFTVHNAGEEQRLNELLAGGWRIWKAIHNRRKPGDHVRSHEANSLTKNVFGHR